MSRLVVHGVPRRGNVSTRNVLALAVLGLALAACDPTTAPTSTTTDVLPPPDPIGSTTSTSTTSTTAGPGPWSGVIAGFLPDETQYVVHIDQPVNTAVEGISAGIVVDVDGAPNAIGIATYLPGDSDVLSTYEDGVYRVQAGGLVQIEFYDHILAELPPSPETVIRTSIRGTTRDDFPVLRLSEPFRWATDDELPLSMEVQYANFVVRRGCGELAVACSETRAVQVIPIDTQSIPIEAWREFEVFVESRAPRPTSDPYYLDPEPLSPRNTADVMWTGEEMIVWGGKEGRDGVPNLIDGAAFNPETNQWRMLAGFPRLGSLGARAIWGDGEMLVVSSEGTLGYDPESDTWREIGQALVPPEFNDRMLYIDGWIYVWDRTSEVHVMDLEIGQWERWEVPPGVSSTYTDQFSGVLREVKGRLVAVALRDSCSGKEFLRHVAADKWEKMPEVDLSTADYGDCSLANQTASVSNGLVIWDAYYTRAMRYSTETNKWLDVFPIPLDGTEGASGPVEMDDDHFMVPRWGEGAIFDATTETWTSIALPGMGTDAEIIWTGEEFLARGLWDSFDAWRWTPPTGSAEGDDTS